MATKKSAAEVELEKAEAEAHKLHPLLTQGNDVAPITRGELKTILGDLLTMMATGKPIALEKDEAALTKLTNDVGNLIGLQFEQQKKITDLRSEVDQIKAAAAPAPPAPADTSGADDLKKLEIPALKDFAKANGVSLDGLPAPLQDDKDALADYIAANMNLPK